MTPTTATPIPTMPPKSCPNPVLSAALLVFVPSNAAADNEEDETAFVSRLALVEVPVGEPLAALEMSPAVETMSGGPWAYGK